VDDIRWGVLSTSGFARRTWIPSVQQSELGRVVAIASRDGTTARRVADELGIPVAHSSYEQLLDDDEIDAVYIPLPNHLHAPWTIAAARAGKHVLCEKPLALSLEDGLAMAEAAEHAQVKLMEAFMYRYHPAWMAFHDLVRAGRIGMLQSVQSWFSYFNDDPANIRNVAAAGGGALNDIGCYSISVARWLFGAEPERVQAAVHLDPDLGVDTLASAVLEFPNGGLATIGCSSRTEPDQWVTAYGRDGLASISIPFNIPFDQSIEVRVVHRGQDPSATDAEVIEFPAANQYTLMADAFARSVLDGTPPPTPIEDALGNLRTLESVRDMGSRP
jgi:predicted dehydrogenase